MITWRAVAAAALLVAACASAVPTSPAPATTATPAATPPPTAADAGPVDAARAAFDTAVAAPVPDQLDFLACVAGGSDANRFSLLFSVLTQLALASSGIDPGEYWAAFATAFDGFEAAELSRSGDQAVVHVSFHVTITPDIAALRKLMRRNLEERGQPANDAAINELVDRLAGPMRVDEVVDNDVEPQLSDGTWHVC